MVIFHGYVSHNQIVTLQIKSLNTQAISMNCFKVQLETRIFLIKYTAVSLNS